MIFHLLLIFIELITSPLLTTKTTPNKSDLSIVKFGYNNFIPSPYSNILAVVPFDSDIGVDLFEKSQHKKAFFKLAPHYVAQQNINSCGVASAIIILNAIDIKSKKTPPISKKGSWYVPEEKTLYGQFVWNEDNFYNQEISEILDKTVLEGDKKIDGSYHVGIELDRLSLALKLQGLDIETHHVTSVSDNSIESFRNLVKTFTQDPTKYIIINYNLNIYTIQGGGHFSPIGAYEATSDSILILDTWSDSNNWLWIKLQDLYLSMNTLDGTTCRGYILISALR